MTGLFVDAANIVEPVSYAGVGFPRIFLNAGELAFFYVEYSDLVYSRVSVLLSVYSVVEALLFYRLVVEI